MRYLRKTVENEEHGSKILGQAYFLKEKMDLEKTFLKVTLT